MIAARRNLFALAALGLCAAATAAGAQQRPPRSPAPLSLQQALAPECGPVDRKQEKRDADKVRAAEAAFARGGFKGLRRHVPALEDVVRRAPKDFEAHESCGMMASLLDGLTRAARTKSGRREVVIEVPAGGSPYPRASLLAGSYAFETGAFEHAAALLLRGLEMTPTDPGLTTEAAGGLTRLGRREEALQFIARTLKQEAGFQPDQRARLHRARGFALVELSRYDEAEEAYRTSLKHEPEHGLAQRELDYIAKLKAGAAPTPARTIGVEEARKAEPD